MLKLIRRTWCVSVPVAFLLAAATASLAQAPPPRPNPPAGRSPLLVNARDYGAKGNGTADDGPAIQRAIDDAAAAGRRATNGAVSDPAEVYVPPGWYNLASGPLYLDQDYVSLRSDGATLVQTGLCPALTVGIPRVDGKRVVDATYRPGGFALSTRGSSGPAYLKFAGGPFDLGQKLGGAWDHYAKTSQLTVDLCMLLARAPGQYVCGMGKAGGLESPWAIWTPGDNPDLINFAYKTAGQSGQNDSPFLARVSLAGLDRSRPINLAFQVDLPTNRAWAFLNGVRVPVDNAGDPRTPGKTFLDNDGVNPFTVGVEGTYEVTMAGPDTIAPITLFGLSAAANLKYRDVPVGDKQFRSDVGRAEDRSTWQVADQGFRVNPWTLPGTLDSVQPGVVVGEPKFVRTQRAFGFIQFPNSQRYAKGNRVTGLHVRHNSVGVLFGTTLETTYADLRVDGGERGLASFVGQSSYPIYADRLNLSGADTPLYLRWCMFRGRDLEFDTSGSDSVRVADSSVTFHNALVKFPGVDQQRVVSFLGGEYGGRFRATDWTVDFEGNTVSDCGFLFRQTSSTPGSVVLDGVEFGSVGQVPLIKLHTWSNEEMKVFWRCTADIKNVTAYGEYGTFVEANGTAWHGTAAAHYLTKGLKYVPNAKGLAPAAAPDLDVRVGNVLK